MLIERANENAFYHWYYGLQWHSWAYETHLTLRWATSKKSLSNNYVVAGTCNSEDCSIYKVLCAVGIVILGVGERSVKCAFYDALSSFDD